MPTFKQGDIVRVPFPYTDRATRQRRPALVVSEDPLGLGGTLLWVVMITSAENQPWPGDIDLPLSPRATGLQAPSVIRACKIATIEADHAERLGGVDRQALDAVLSTLRVYLGI